MGSRGCRRPRTPSARWRLSCDSLFFVVAGEAGGARQAAGRLAMETWMVVGVIVVSVVALCLFLAYKQMQRAEMQEPGREAPQEE